MQRSVPVLGAGLILCVLGFVSGCGDGYESAESAREEVQQQEELRKSQAAEEAILNEDLMRGERRK